MFLFNVGQALLAALTFMFAIPLLVARAALHTITIARSAPSAGTWRAAARTWAATATSPITIVSIATTTTTTATATTGWSTAAAASTALVTVTIGRRTTRIGTIQIDNLSVWSFAKNLRESDCDINVNILSIKQIMADVTGVEEWERLWLVLFISGMG